MKVIFLQDVPRVGRRHDVKEVNDGYALNFLFPKKLAKPATAQALSELEKMKSAAIIKKEIQEDLLQKSLDAIKGKIITMKMKADDKGHLFSSIHKKDLIELMKKDHKAEISEDSIVLEKPIKEIGEFEIQISIKNKHSSFVLKVVKI